MLRTREREGDRRRWQMVRWNESGKKESEQGQGQGQGQSSGGGEGSHGAVVNVCVGVVDGRVSLLVLRAVQCSAVK